jgi:tetratricopeptide (TPR) repeat protein
MPEISLRGYVKEIDDLVEREALDEAIAHARHILQTYPKHIEAYRLLGKAYLEAKRYGDAADIFQRVLSALPDDFIAHIGMAIVREDEGNLDSSIWHMERAYETNPSNPAIRQELKRLIGRRDGLEPHTVRYTRGALARLYAHGELHAQAITELRSALQDDPERPDLQVLLADMYWRTSQPAEATAICTRILEKLPFCMQANRIVAAALQTASKPEEASTYLSRLASLDPYSAFLETAVAEPTGIDDSAVQVERLEWQPGQPIPLGDAGQPSWAADLGVDLTEEEEEPVATGPLPSWLEPQVPAGNPISMETNDQSLSSDDVPEEGDIPEWMREAGWGDSSGEAQETPISFSDEELSSLDEGVLPADVEPTPEEPTEQEPPASEEEQEPEAPEPTQDPEGLAPADIPNWLQDIAPEGGEELEEAPTESGVPDWMSDVATDAEEVSSEPAPDQPVVDDKVDIEELVEAEAEPAPSDSYAEPPTQPTGAENGKDIPTWAEEEAPGATETIVTWLEDREEAAANEPTGDEAGDETMDAELAVAAAAAEMPSWMQDDEPDSDEGEDEPAAEAPAAEEQPSEQALPGWLSGVAEAAAKEDEHPTGEFGRFLSEVETGDLQEPEEFDIEAIEESEEEIELEVTPEPEVAEVSDDWLEAEVDETPEPEPAQVPGWLQGIAEGAPADEPGLPSDESMDWLDGLAEPEASTDAEAVPAEGAEWLEGIGGDEEADLPSDAPNWLQDIAERKEVEDVPEDMASEDTVDWIRNLEEETEEVEAPVEGTLDWLQETADQEPGEPELEIEEPSVLEPEPATPPAAPADEIDDAEVADWLESLATRHGTEDEELAAVSDLETAEPELVIEDKDIPEEPGQSLEWLDTLARQRGMDVDVTMGAGQPPMPGTAEWDETPEWLRQMTPDRARSEQPPEPAPSDDPTIVAPTRDIPDEPPDTVVEQAPEALAETKEQEVEDTISIEPEIEVPEWLIEQAAQEEESLVEPAPEPEAEKPEVPQAVTEPDSADEATAETGADTELEAVETADAELDVKAEVDAEVVEAAVETLEPEPAMEVDAVEVEVDTAGPQPIAEAAAEPTLSAAQEALEGARLALASGDIDKAVELYGRLIKKKKDLATVIQDVKVALERSPKQPALWQALGDAYMNNDQVDDAIEAYRQGMEAA